MAQAPVKLNIERAGQPYVDELIQVRPLEVASAVRKAVGGRDLRCVVTGFDRVPLHWMKPKGKTS